MTHTTDQVCPGIFRHLAIMTYDLLLLASVLLVAGFIAVAFNGGEAISSSNPFFMLYILGISFFFYGWFWTHGGQTLGMRAWKVYLVSNQQYEITWLQAAVRFVVTIITWLPFGMGFWWQYIGKDNRSWPDYFSGTRLHCTQNATSEPN
jgi:uncharacterized RDD family membrane protein YckC